MTDSQDQPPDPPYSPEDLRQFAKTLGIPDLSPAHVKQMQSAALGYLFLAATEAKPRDDEKWRRLLPSRKERRKALQTVAEAARALKDALENQALIFLEKKDKLPVLDPSALEALAATAVIAAERIPGGGDDPKLARNTFVRRLADIFEDATQNPATRRHDGITGLDYGPFLEFAQAALKPLKARALKGLEHDVRRVTEAKMPDAFQLNKHPLNQRAKQLLHQAKHEPWSDTLHLVRLLIAELEYGLPELTVAKLCGLDPEKVMKLMDEELKLEDLEDLDPYGAAFRIAEAMGFDMYELSLLCPNE